MIRNLLRLVADPAAEAELFREAGQFVRQILDSAGTLSHNPVRDAEKAIQSGAGTFAFDGEGFATLTALDHSWQAGRFETPSLGELRRRTGQKGQGGPSGEARLWVLDGRSPATDIGALQATASKGSLFQVASQFNCLESPGPFLTPVANYFSDNTQGPRASISAFPATLLRHYSAPGPAGRFEQSDELQIDLLSDVFESGHSPVLHGYLGGHGGMGAAGLARALESGFERIRVGVHEGAQVVLGYDWEGAVEDSENRRIAQVLTSTAAGGGYGAQRSLGEEFIPVCRQTLRAAYLGTLLAAVSLGQELVVLTLVGGGVFRNPLDLIWESILWAFDEAGRLASGPFDVVLNGFGLQEPIRPEQILPQVRARGGAVLVLGRMGLVEVMR